jgi:hypothetical protein
VVADKKLIRLPQIEFRKTPAKRILSTDFHVGQMYECIITLRVQVHSRI